jgi:SPFH domain / Band 7 family
MALEVASRIALNGPLLSKSVTAALATRSFALTRATSLPILKAQQQQRQLHVAPRTRAPNNSLLGVSSNSNVPSSYFQRPSLPANTIIRFVPQQTAWIVERMGKFNRILQPGLAILWPFLDRISYVKSLKEAAIEIPSQSAITADNVTLELDGELCSLPLLKV